MQNNLIIYNEVSPRFHRPRGSANEEFERTWTGGESLGFFSEIRRELGQLTARRSRGAHTDSNSLRSRFDTSLGAASSTGGARGSKRTLTDRPRRSRAKSTSAHIPVTERERHGRTEASAMADPATGAVTAPITIKIRQQEPAGEHSLTVAGDVRARDDTTPIARLLPLPPASTTFLFVLLPSRPHGNDRVRV